jgi:LysM repeat protein
MHKNTSRLFGLLLCLSLVATAAGCFQPAGAGLEATNVAFVAPNLTAEPIDVFEPEPTVEDLPINGESPTLEVVEVAQLPSETPTPDEMATLAAQSTEIAATQTALAAPPTQDELATLFAESTAFAQTLAAQTLQAGLFPTATPTPDFLATFDAQSTMSAGTQVADASGAAAQDELAGTATALAIELFGETAPQGGQQPIDTFTQLDPGFQTATAAIQIATFEAALQQTQTTEAILGQFTTPSPTFDFGILTQQPGGGAGGSDFATATSFVPVPGGACSYVVQRGDNLFRISLRYNTTVHEIAALSGIANINLIVVGQQLTIPNCAGSGSPGSTVTFAPPPPGGCRTYYRVRQNDTLFRISMTYSTTVNALAAANPQITNVNLIYIDQEICIP